MSEMMKLYIPEPIPGVPALPFVVSDVVRGGSHLFEGMPTYQYFSKLCTRVATPQEAEAFLFPHAYAFAKHQPAFHAFLQRVREANKKCILFAYGDSDEVIVIPEAIILRSSQYRYKLQANEILMPAYVEDLGKSAGLQWRSKSAKPVVGFCGWAGLSTWSGRVKFFLKRWRLEWRAFVSGSSALRAQVQGLYFRQRAIAFLRRSAAVETRFIIRSSYSGHVKTIQLTPEDARREYVENMQTTDFALAPKGDGNYSARFYEALSLGRIPVLVDTECILPLEGIVPYEECILRVDFQKLDTIATVIATAYGSWSEAVFLAKQQKAREVFERYLSGEAFFSFIFTDRRSPLILLLQKAS